MSRPQQATALTVGATLFLASAAATGSSGGSLVRIGVAGAVLAATTVTDIRERRIPNSLVLPGIACCAVLALPAVGAFWPIVLPALLATLLLGVALARPDAIGMGDAKLAVLVLVGLSTQGATALIIGLALAAGAGLTLVARHGRKALHSALPLAPFLTAGALLSLLISTPL